MHPRKNIGLAFKPWTQMNNIAWQFLGIVKAWQTYLDLQLRWSALPSLFLANFKEASWKQSKYSSLNEDMTLRSRNRNLSNCKFSPKLPLSQFLRSFFCGRTCSQIFVKLCRLVVVWNKIAGSPYSFWSRSNLSVRDDSLRYQGSFSIDDADGSEHVTVKRIWVFLACAYSSSMKMWKCRWISWAPHSSLDRKKKFFLACLRPPENVKLGIFTS